MLLHHILENAARSRPDKPAVWFKEQWLTYGELEDRSSRLAGHLAGSGLRPGDRVAVLLDNSFDFIVSHFAISMAGGVNVSLNTETTAKSLAFLLGDCEARILIAGRRFVPMLSEACRDLTRLEQIILDLESGPTLFQDGIRVHVLPEILCGPVREKARPARVDIDLACIVYTSGSTGRPKGVMLSHLNLVSNCRSISKYLELGENDRMMVVLPFYYIYGKSLMYTHFMTCGSLVIDNRFAFPNVVLDTMRKLEVTGFAGVPSTFTLLLNKSSLKKQAFQALRFVTQAGGAMPPNVQKEAAEVFHPAKLFVMYGSTEAAPRLTYLDPGWLSQKWGSIGKAIPNVEVIIAGERGERLPPGSIGEIAARGSNIMMGYWRDSAGTAEVLRNGYYYTGDLGREDEDGFLFVVGRTKDIIKAGGNRVSAKEIEEALSEIPGVLESAVIGVPDEILGEAIKAVVVLKDGAALSAETVRAELKPRLPAFKLPKWVEFRDALPKNEAGKVMKAVLREE